MPNFSFPLPLTAFEEYMLRDDRPNYPMSIIARLSFSGQLDRQATAEALETAVARHPLLRATIRKTPAGRMEWIDAADRSPAISWIDDPPHDRLPTMRPIDLFSEPGLKCWASANVERSSLVLQVHHAACDGKGVSQVLDDFMRSYSHISGGKQSALELAPSDPPLLHGRGSFGLTVRKYLGMLPGQLLGLSRVYMFFMHRPVPLLKRIAAMPDELPASFPDVLVGNLDADDVRKLSAAAADAKVTANDWLLRDFFAAVDDFRARHEAGPRGEWLRLSVPLSLRNKADMHMPAANVVSMVFLDRTRKQIAAADLLRGIHDEMDSIRRRQLGMIFIVSLWGLRLLPGGMAMAVNRNRCDSTCVLSNLGRAMADSPLPRRNEKIVAGNVVLEDIDIIAPIRRDTAVSMTLIYYAGGLRLCMHFDRRHLTEAQAGELMGTYLRTIRESTGAGETDRPVKCIPPSAARETHKR